MRETFLSRNVTALRLSFETTVPGDLRPHFSRRRWDSPVSVHQRVNQESSSLETAFIFFLIAVTYSSAPPASATVAAATAACLEGR